MHKLIKKLAVAILSAPFFMSCEIEEQVIPTTDAVTESTILEAKSSDIPVNDFSGVDRPGAQGNIRTGLRVGDKIIVTPTRRSALRPYVRNRPVGKLKIVSLAARQLAIQHGLLRDYEVRVLNDDQIEIIRVDRTNINPTTGKTLWVGFTAQMEDSIGDFYEVGITLSRPQPTF